MKKTQLETKKTALRIAKIAEGKKAEDLGILEMLKVTNFCDYFVILSASSTRQAGAISKAVVEELAKDDLEPLSKSPTSQTESGWILLDFGSVITHIFYKPLREFYALEKLWGDAKVEDITEEKPLKKTAKTQKEISTRKKN